MDESFKPVVSQTFLHVDPQLNSKMLHVRNVQGFTNVYNTKP